jgi:SAM-dependent methyltransferase
MEAMAMGLPTIASRFSGNLEFMHDGNSWLVNGELVPVPDDADLINDLYRGHQWFEPDVAELAAALAAIAGDPETARAKAAGAREELIERFGPDATARRVLELTCEALGMALPAAASAAGHGAASRVTPELRAFAAQFTAERQPILDFMLRVADELPPGARVLDVGAGEAPYRELFAHVDYRTSDWANSVHEGARRVDFVGPGDELPVPDESFDAVIMTQVLEHVADPVAVLSEQFRVLRPGGRIFITVPLAWELHEMPYDFYRYTSPGIEHVLRRAGFHDVRVEARNDCFSTVGQLLRNLGVAMGRAGDGLNGERELAAARMVEIAREVESLAHLDVQRIFPLGWAAHAVRPDAATARAACDLGDARGVAVLAFADELLRRPELLRAYGEQFGPDDDATLVIYSPGADPVELEQRLVAAVADAGLDGEGTSDLLAMPLGAAVEDERLLATAVDALLSASPAGGAFVALPAFGPDDAAALRAHVDAALAPA